MRFKISLGNVQCFKHVGHYLSYFICHMSVDLHHISIDSHRSCMYTQGGTTLYILNNSCIFLI